MRVKNRRELASLRFLWYNAGINYLMEVGMIKFKQTGEIFSDIFAAKEALLSFAEKTDPKKRQKACKNNSSVSTYFYQNFKKIASNY